MSAEITVRNLAASAASPTLVPVKSAQGHWVYKVPPGAQISLNLDNKALQGNEAVGGKPLKLTRVGRQLQVRADDEVLLVLDDYYAEGGATLQGAHWPQAIEVPAGTMQADASAAAAAPDGAASAALTPAPLFGLGALGAGVGGVAAIAGLTGGNQTSTIVSGQVVAGPVIAGHGLTVEIYAADGKTLLATATVQAGTGKFTANVGNYSGVIVAKLIDANDGLDYRDEATKLNKDLTAVFTAVGVVTAGQSLALNLTALTTLAARQAGVQPDGTVNAAIKATDAQAGNAAVSKAFGIADIAGGSIVAVVNTDGTANPAANLYGKVLAALSGMEKAPGIGTDQVLTQLVGHLAADGSLSQAGQVQVILGAARAGVSVAEVATAVSGEGNGIANNLESGTSSSLYSDLLKQLGATQPTLIETLDEMTELGRIAKAVQQVATPADRRAGPGASGALSGEAVARH